MKFIRAFCYGLDPDSGETTTVVHGKTVSFSYQTPQVDIAIDDDVTTAPTPAPDSNPPAN